MKKPATVVIIEDHTIVRESLISYLKKYNDYIEIVGEAKDVSSGRDIIKNKKPDLVLLDLSLPDRSGLDLIKELKFDQKGYGKKSESNDEEDIKIVVLSMFDTPANVCSAFMYGTDGYILKTDSADHLVNLLKNLIDGKEEFVLSQTLSNLREDITNLRKGKATKKVRAKVDPLGKLSKREREIFYLITKGLPNRVIASKLLLSPRTVETHRARVIKKLECKTTVDVVRYAMKHHLIS